MNIKNLKIILTNNFKLNYDLICLSVKKKSRMLNKHLKKVDYSLTNSILIFK